MPHNRGHSAKTVYSVRAGSSLPQAPNTAGFVPGVYVQLEVVDEMTNAEVALRQVEYPGGN